MQRRRFIKAFALSAAAIGLGLAWARRPPTPSRSAF